MFLFISTVSSLALSIHPSIYQHIYIYIYIYISVCLSVCLSVRPSLSVCLSLSLSLCMSACLCICACKGSMYREPAIDLSTDVSDWQSPHLFLRNSPTHLSYYLPICLPFYLTIYLLPMYLCIHASTYLSIFEATR